MDKLTAYNRLWICLASLFYLSIFLTIVFFVWTIFYLVVIIPWKIEHGHDWKGISHKYHVAVQEKNGKEAIFWAKKMQAYEILDKGGRNSLRMIADAYALDGQHEVAEHYYALAKLLQDERIPPP